MRKDQKPVMVDPETHKRLKKLSEETGVGLSMGAMIKSLVNMVENRVEYEKKHGGIPVEHPKISNPLLETYGQPTENYSDYMVYVALHLRDIGMIPEKTFQDNREDLPFFVFKLGSEVVQKVDPDRL